MKTITHLFNNSILFKKTCTQLDVRTSDNDVVKLVEYYNRLDILDIKHPNYFKSFYHSNGKSGFHFLECLQSKKPDISIQEFCEVAKDLDRNDIVFTLKDFIQTEIFFGYPVRDKREEVAQLLTRTNNTALKYWPSFADSFKFETEIIEHINLNGKQEVDFSPAKRLLTQLKDRKGERSISDFKVDLRLIGRSDLACNIEEWVRKLSNNTGNPDIPETLIISEVHQQQHIKLAQYGGRQHLLDNNPPICTNDVSKVSMISLPDKSEICSANLRLRTYVSQKDITDITTSTTSGTMYDDNDNDDDDDFSDADADDDDDDDVDGDDDDFDENNGNNNVNDDNDGPNMYMVPNARNAQVSCNSGDEGYGSRPATINVICNIPPQYHETEENVVGGSIPEESPEYESIPGIPMYENVDITNTQNSSMCEPAAEDIEPDSDTGRPDNISSHESLGSGNNEASERVVSENVYDTLSIHVNTAEVIEKNTDETEPRNMASDNEMVPGVHLDYEGKKSKEIIRIRHVGNIDENVQEKEEEKCIAKQLPSIPEVTSHPDQNNHGGEASSCKCVIITNDKLDQNGKVTVINKVTVGIYEEKKLMKEIFNKNDFATIEHNDVRAKEMFDFLNIHARDNTSYAGFICCIMTWGLDGKIKGDDGDELNINQIIDTFKAEPSLKGKPKIFIIRLFQTSGNVENNMPAPKLDEEECVVVYTVTCTGNKTWLKCNGGSWFIEGICRLLVQHKCENVLDIYRCLCKEKFPEDLLPTPGLLSKIQKFFGR